MPLRRLLGLLGRWAAATDHGNRDRNQNHERQASVTFEIKAEAAKDDAEPLIPEPDGDDVPEPVSARPDAPDDDFDARVEAAVSRVLLNAPAMEGDVDERDVVPTISHNKLWLTRWRDAPVQGGVPGAEGQAPVIVTGETDETLITAYGARGESYKADTKALEEAGKRTANGGVIKVPIGRFKIDQADLPSHKNWTLRGTSMRGSELVGAPGHDIIRIEGFNAQRRLQNQHIFERISFYVNSDGNADHSRQFKRRTWAGEPVAHAAIAYLQERKSDDSTERKHNWVNSFPILDRVFVHGDKNSNGPAALWADNCIYGLKVLSLFIGDHSNSAGGVPMGCVIGRPPLGHSDEFTPDELHIGVMTHFNARCSVSAANVANGVINHLVCYGSTGTAIDLAGVDAGARKRCRDIVVSGQIYVDNDPHPTKSDQPLINIDSDFCKLNLLHVKGSRVKHGATHRPVVKLSGSRIKGDITVMSSSHHKAPRFEISGDHHDLTISAGGVHGDERKKLINGRSSIAGVTVV